MAIVNLGISVLLLAALCGWLQANQNRHGLFWMVIGASTLLYSAVPQFGFMIVGDAAYPGHTKGFEITILDIAIVGYLINKRGANKDIRTPFRKVMVFYFVAAFASALVADYYRASLFYVFQLLRMYATYRAIMIATLDEENYQSFLKGIAIGVFGELLFVLYQRFGQGSIQPSGTFGHQNQLGLISNLLMFTVASSFLAGDRKPSRLISVAATLVASALTGSRATTGLAFMGLAACYFQSLYHGASSRKVKLGVVGAVVGLILGSIAWAQLQVRFENEAKAGYSSTEDGSMDERNRFVAASSMMLADHPLGVGANNFVLMANVGGYYDRAGVIPTTGSRAAHVHNIYWLTLAELGYFGFLALMAVILVPIIAGLRAAMKYRRERNGEVAGGLAVALMIAFLHSYYEWLIVTSYAQYFVAIVLGLLASRIIILERRAVPAVAGESSSKSVAPRFKPHVGPAPGMAKSRF